jgi:hypothetical protein
MPRVNAPAMTAAEMRAPPAIHRRRRRPRASSKSTSGDSRSRWTSGPGGQPWNGVSPQAAGALLTSVVVGYIARLAIVGDDATEDLSGMIAALIPDVDRSEVPG